MHSFISAPAIFAAPSLMVLSTSKSSTCSTEGTRLRNSVLALATQSFSFSSFDVLHAFHQLCDFRLRGLEQADLDVCLTNIGIKAFLHDGLRLFQADAGTTCLHALCNRVTSIGFYNIVHGIRNVASLFSIIRDRKGRIFLPCGFETFSALLC